jgi:DNA mismatch repair protein MutH
MAESIDQPSQQWLSPKLIVEHADKLRGKRIMDLIAGSDVKQVCVSTSSKAAFGTLLEETYYGIRPGNSPLPDFPEAQLELKSTPLIRRRKGLVAKERLVLNKIDFNEESKATFTTSSFFRKCRRLLVVGYIHDSSKTVEKLKVASVVLIALDLLPLEDRVLIVEDWKIIHDKICNGKAHEISEGDTRVLAACTKGASGTVRVKQVSGPDARPRAYSLKRSYVSDLLSHGMSSLVFEKPTVPYGSSDGYVVPESNAGWPQVFTLSDSELTFEQKVVQIFEQYIGQSVSQLYQDFGVNSKAKNANALLVKKIIGQYSRTAELIDASGLQIKTVQLKANGSPKESMSFPAFTFANLLNESWDDIDEDEQHFRNLISGRFMFVLFQCSGDCKSTDNKFFRGIKFWNMPFKDIGVVRSVWEETKIAVSQSNPSLFAKARQKRIVHVRPHGRNRRDTDILPDGTTVTKRCFWLNASYIRDVVRDQ